jgi:hypothetical protein
MSEKHDQGITSSPSPHHDEPEPPHGTAAGEAHHAEHASQDSFARRVAISMVVVAAVLAAVKVLGHRAHNDTLRYQIDANDLRTQAASFHTKADTFHTRANEKQTLSGLAQTKASNQWSYYQAKKLRQHFYEAQSELIAALAKDGATAGQSAQVVERWKANSEKYGKETKEIMDKAQAFDSEAEQFQKEAKHHDHEAHDVEHEAKHLEEHAGHLVHQSHHAHAQGDRYDLGEMGVELALVLCSVAILTRRPGFWYGGLALGVVGALIAASGLFVA